MNNQEWKHLGLYLYIISHSFIMYELKMHFQNNKNENNRAQQWRIWIRNWSVIYQMFEGKINLMEFCILVDNCDSLKKKDVFFVLLK